jgi:peptidyl-prolyl cis-trans isomerase SurA
MKPPMKPLMKPTMRSVLPVLLAVFFGAAGMSAQTQAKDVVVEEIVARVNNDVITLSDLARARGSLENETREECQGCTDAQFRERLAAKQKNLLRDLIDQSLLAQRAKDLGIDSETELIKRLDAIRQQYKLPSMEALEQEVTKAGQNYEDFKNQLRNQILTQDVIRREVGSKIIISHEEISKYYEAHKKDFVRPATVILREIFVSTEGKPASDIPELRKKAENLRERVLKNGDDFGELAKRFSDSPTKQQGGDLGAFQQSQLDPRIAEQVFSLNRGQMTSVIETKTGFELLQVRERFEAGQQPLEKVEGEITNRLYEQKMEPALRAYLKTLREDSYVQIKPGYVDTAAVPEQPIEEVTAQAEKAETKKKSGRKLLIF